MPNEKAETAMAIQNFRDLDAWKVAMDLAESVYKIVERLPGVERFELASQMRRAAVSVPSNVAEGHASGSDRRFRYHVGVSLGSVGELSTCVELCRRFGYIDLNTADGLEEELTRQRQLLYGLHKSILARLAKNGAMILIFAYLCSRVF